MAYLRSRTVVLVVVLVAALAAPALTHPAVVLYDRPGDRPYLRAQDAPVAVDADAFSALLSSLLGVRPASPVGPEVSRQVDQLATPDIFSKPSAVISINIAGLSQEEAAHLFHKGKLQAIQSSPADLLNSMDGLFSQFEDSVIHYPLDAFALQGCEADCAEASLQEAASHMGGSYTPNTGLMDGTLHLSSQGSPVLLDLSNEAERMYAIEVSALHKAVDDIVAETSGHNASSLMSLAKYMDCTMMGLQMLRDTYGPDSQEFKAAYESLAALTSSLMEDLCSCHEDKVVGQVALLGDMQASASSMDAKQPLRARSLAEVADSALTTIVAAGDGEKWSIMALTWTAFWVLLWFTWLCIYSLCTMPFKQDSLLYSTTKSE